MLLGVFQTKVFTCWWKTTIQGWDPFPALGEASQVCVLASWAVFWGGQDSFCCQGHPRESSFLPGPP